MPVKGRRQQHRGMKTPNNKNPIVNRLEKSAAKTKRRVGSVIPALSSLAGSFLGGPAGGAVGLAAGKLISSITGYGDYKIQRNSLSMGNSVPSFRQGGDGVRLCHREFIRDVIGSPDFSLQTFPINPGMAVTFPWLSYMGSHFEEYELNGLVFEYRPTSGSAVSSTSSALGVVIFATDYDAANPSFTNKQQMESYEFSTSTVPFNGCLHPVECARNRNVLDNLYLRTNAPPDANADIRLYDMGNMQYATQGMQSTYVVGELWVSYDVSFKKPRLPSILPRYNNVFGHLWETPQNTSSKPNYFGTLAGPKSLAPDSTMTIDDIECFPSYCVIKKAGQYRYSTFWTGATSGASLVLTLGTSFSWDSSFRHGTSYNDEEITTTRGSSIRSFFVTSDGAGPSNYLGLSVVDTSGLDDGHVDFLLNKISSLTATSITTSTCGTDHLPPRVFTIRSNDPPCSPSSFITVDCKSD